jgi:hypothetical protein
LARVGDDPKQPVQEDESWFAMLALEHGELLAKREIFQQVLAGTEEAKKSPDA